jgi:hypothetical protein
MIQAFQKLILKLTNSEEKITCYHCAEKSRKKDTVYVSFDGEIRPVCCYGCAAVLKTVEDLGMHEEYLNSKIIPEDNSQPP